MYTPNVNLLPKVPNFELNIIPQFFLISFSSTDPFWKQTMLGGGYLKAVCDGHYFVLKTSYTLKSTKIHDQFFKILMATAVATG
jgi:hypothetical protein